MSTQSVFERLKMQSIDKEKFCKQYEAIFGTLKPEARANLQILLAFLVADEKITDIRHAAYVLATVKHECAGTYAPIEEYGKGKGRKYGVKDSRTRQTYYGRGYVQLTWLENYANMGRILKLDLVNLPGLALKYDIAYQIMSHGMRNGSFTGSKLSKHIDGDKCDYVGARRIINGQDCAGRIAIYAEKLESILKTSKCKGA